MASPNQEQNRNQDEFSSPWIDSFQTNPHHQAGNYDFADPRADDTQRPTLDALFEIYDAHPTTDSSN